MDSRTSSISSLVEIEAVTLQLEKELKSCSVSTKSANSISPVSTGSNKAEGDVEFQCGVCNESVVNPKVLSCLHAFCETCQETDDCPLCPDTILFCNSCVTHTTEAVAECSDCKKYLCSNCVLAHQFMQFFEGHKVIHFTDTKILPKKVTCSRHNEDLYYFCKTCNTPICKDCLYEHPIIVHDVRRMDDVGTEEIINLTQTVQKYKSRSLEIQNIIQNVDNSLEKLESQYQKAQNEVNETYQFYLSMIQERRQDLLKEVESVFSAKQLSMSFFEKEAQMTVDKIFEACDFHERLMKRASVVECLLFKDLIETNLKGLSSYVDEKLKNFSDLEFVSNYQTIQVGVKNTFGYIRVGNDSKNALKCDKYLTDKNHGLLGSLLENELRSVNLGPFPTSIRDTNSINLQNFSDLTKPVPHPKSKIERQKMIYHCKFGEFGALDGQFSEPSGVAVNAQNDIIVADTNNHRVQIFDKEGRFKFQFGECGHRDGQLFYPNRVTVVKTSGDIIVSERAPTHQIQIYNQYGQFVRKFGSNILQHPRGLAVDNKGRIIVVECKVMRVIIFDQTGNMLRKFGCSKHLAFPNGVVVNNKQEIFISDNRAHCVRVFNYEGVFLRQIGGEGITNYPIGVGINSEGEILVADNHNNFNLTIFSSDGILLSALESKVKHVQCYDFAILDDKSVVLASKDYRLYIYGYLNFPSALH